MEGDLAPDGVLRFLACPRTEGPFRHGRCRCRVDFEFSRFDGPLPGEYEVEFMRKREKSAHAAANDDPPPLHRARCQVPDGPPFRTQMKFGG